MRKDEKKTHGKFYRAQTNISWFKIGRTNFGSPVHGDEGGVKSWNFWKISKTPMRKDEKKTHSKFHSDQMNRS